MDERIFALDIGTRSVTGILLEKQNNTFSVIDYFTKEHKERSMRDGQIHNVIEVANVIKEVKDTLEQSNGILTNVCVAAAGRSLKTVQSRATISLNQQPITENETIKHLELSAVQAAQINLATQEKENDYTNYYCVGYSVLHYTLDGEQIGSLIDQSGDQAAVEIIATFLPKIVVESLLAALNRAGLEMDALTLEPIAAIDVLIPESMRRLNVALVDIGAGTSDIAITDKGTVVAYGMVPIAGDEITEAISDQYLLDFPTAENTKRNIVNEGNSTVKDILGFKTTISYEMLVSDITENVERLADAITEEILQLNSKPPKAIMLVGGGSLTPEITTVLAKKLQLPANRVAVRDISAIQNLSKTEQLQPGPESVTPIGIAIAAKENPVHYVSVSVNNKAIRMFEMKQLTIGDCLVQAGIDVKKLYGKPGIASIVLVNGKEITLPGELGGAPAILLNDKTASVEDVIENSDKLLINKGNDGSSPKVTLEQLMGEVPSYSLYFNKKTYEIKTSFYVNGKLQPSDYIVQDKDEIVLKQHKTVSDFLEYASTDTLLRTNPFLVYVDNKEVTLENGESHIYVNNKKSDINKVLKENDHITITTAVDPVVQDLLVQLDKEYYYKVQISFNGEPITMYKQQLTITKNQLELKINTPLEANDHLKIAKRTHEPFIFQDVFRYVDIDLSNVKGNFELYKNKQPTTFFEEVQHGDELEIKWNG
ncbi:cell division protein FtsA [Virgibacillus byunsanensis]|uniref:Cell division protein FtsA n=1 Tax=Virgibacillus byunsanensis TaxID=570945 RepID=A0ABW3LIE8_9BACI